MRFNVSSLLGTKQPLMPGLKATFNASFEGSLLKHQQYCIICKEILLRG